MNLTPRWKTISENKQYHLKNVDNLSINSNPNRSLGVFFHEDSKKLSFYFDPEHFATEAHPFISAMCELLGTFPLENLLSRNLTPKELESYLRDENHVSVLSLNKSLEELLINSLWELKNLAIFSYLRGEISENKEVFPDFLGKKVEILAKFFQKEVFPLLEHLGTKARFIALEGDLIVFELENTYEWGITKGIEEKILKKFSLSCINIVAEEHSPS